MVVNRHASLSKETKRWVCHFFRLTAKWQNVFFALAIFLFCAPDGFFNSSFLSPWILPLQTSSCFRTYVFSKVSKGQEIPSFLFAQKA